MIIQDDEFLTGEEQQEIKNWLIWTPLWSFNETTSGILESENPSFLKNETFQLVMPVFQDSPVYYPCLKVLNKFLTKHQIGISEIIRIKSNIMLQSNNPNYQSPHVDQKTEHKVFLYYINDSDGDTVFFNEFWSEQNEDVVIDGSLTEQIRIKPKMGRGVVFDGLQYHASSSPQLNGWRCVLNIDFI